MVANDKERNWERLARGEGRKMSKREGQRKANAETASQALQDTKRKHTNVFVVG
jgi:hypothetical protein